MDILVYCCWNALSGIGSIVQAAATMGLFVLALKKGNQAYRQWQNGKDVQRSKFLAELIDRFEKDNIQDMVSMADDSTVAQKWLQEVFNNRQKELEAQSSLRFFSYICYLMDKKLITENEFG